MRRRPTPIKLLKFLVTSLISISTIFTSTLTYANDDYYATKVFESFFILRDIESNKISGFYLFNKMPENNASSEDVAESLMEHAAAIKTALNESKTIIDSKKYDKVCSRTNSERFYEEWNLTFNLLDKRKLVIYCSSIIRKPTLYTLSHNYTKPSVLQLGGNYEYISGKKKFNGKPVELSQYRKMLNILENGAKLINDGKGELFANQEFSYMTWQLKWIIEEGETTQCIVETPKAAVESYQVKLIITDNTALDVGIFNKVLSDDLPNAIRIRVDNQNFDSTRYVNKKNSRLFNYPPEEFTKISTAINKAKKYIIELYFENDTKSVELVEPHNAKTMLHGSIAKQYCDVMKNNLGSFGIMFVDAIQNKSVNDYIATQSSYKKAGVVLMGVAPSKKAYKYGLRLFDVLLGVDGNPVDVKTLGLILKSLDKNESITFNVLRDDAFLDFKIVR